MIEAKQGVAEVEVRNGVVGPDASSQFVDAGGAAREDSAGDEAVELFEGGGVVDAEKSGDFARGDVAVAGGHVLEDGPALPASEG